MSEEEYQIIEKLNGLNKDMGSTIERLRRAIRIKINEECELEKIMKIN